MQQVTPSLGVRLKYNAHTAPDLPHKLGAGIHASWLISGNRSLHQRAWFTAAQQLAVGELRFNSEFSAQ